MKRVDEFRRKESNRSEIELNISKEQRPIEYNDDLDIRHKWGSFQSGRLTSNFQVLIRLDYVSINLEDPRRENRLEKLHRNFIKIAFHGKMKYSN